MAAGWLPRVLPWIDWEEWMMVKNGLYSGHGSQQQAALEVVALWKLRGKVPHSVESTAQLLEISIYDQPGQQQSPWKRSETELRMHYSLAMVRAVNGLVDSSQQGYFADSIHGIAAAMGLPAWFVELRHDATHNQLPSLSVLRAACGRLVLWFYSHYWEPQAGYLQHISYVCVTGTEKSSSSVRDLSTDTPLEGFEALVKSAGVGWTFATEIFLPLFLQSIYVREEPSSSSTTKASEQSRRKHSDVSGDDSSVATNTMTRQTDFWLPQLLLLAASLPSTSSDFIGAGNGDDRDKDKNKGGRMSGFWSVLLTRLCVSSLDAVEAANAAATNAASTNAESSSSSSSAVALTDTAAIVEPAYFPVSSSSSSKAICAFEEASRRVSICHHWVNTALTARNLHNNTISTTTAGAATMMHAEGSEGMVGGEWSWMPAVEYRWTNQIRPHLLQFTGSSSSSSSSSSFPHEKTMEGVCIGSPITAADTLLDQIHTLFVLVTGRNSVEGKTETGAGVKAAGASESESPQKRRRNDPHHHNSSSSSISNNNNNNNNNHSSNTATPSVEGGWRLCDDFPMWPIGSFITQPR